MREICCICEGMIASNPSQCLPGPIQPLTYYYHVIDVNRAGEVSRLRMIALARPSRIDILPLTASLQRLVLSQWPLFEGPGRLTHSKYRIVTAKGNTYQTHFSNNNFENPYFNFRWLLHLDQEVSRADVFVELSGLLSASLRTQSGPPAL